MKSSWIRYRIERPQAGLRLFCLPYAGGSASIYLNWVRTFSSEIEVCPVQLPGREERIREKTICSLNEMTKNLEKALLPFLDIPFAFYGHSMGALIAFELVRSLRRNHGLLPTCLFVSGRRAPQICSPVEPIYRLTDAEFAKEIKCFQGTPEAVFENPVLMRIVLPYLKADFELCETYQYYEEDPLECALGAYCGLADEMAPPISMEPWEELTNSSFDLEVFPGEHFFLHECEPSIRRSIEGALLGRTVSNITRT